MYVAYICFAQKVGKPVCIPTMLKGRNLSTLKDRTVELASVAPLNVEFRIASEADGVVFSIMGFCDV